MPKGEAIMDEHGHFVVVEFGPEGMSIPVRCRCGQVYDLGMVNVTSRYADCSVWQTPCCNRQADDREWKSLPDFTRLKRR